MAEAESQFTCAYCQIQANQRCTGCHVTFYCSREHQKLHWKKHKNRCCSYKICNSETLGRYLVATRDLKPGELILMEAPTIIAPMAVTPPVCLSCYAPVDGRYMCPLCGWPMCNEICRNSPAHIPECRITAERGSPIKIAVTINKPFPLYEVVALLRCLYMKEKSSEKYKALIRLEPHTKERIKNGKYSRDKMTMLRVIREFFSVPSTRFPDEDILALCGILFVNSHEVPVTMSPSQALYQNASLLEHSCVNNASKHFDMNCNILIRVAIPIKKGEHISIMYSDPIWGTVNRQQHLLETKFFTCRCIRCQDPTELNTHFSSIRCPGCPAGFLVSLDPFNYESDWKCETCNRVETPRFVNAVIRSIGEELISLEKGSPEACLSFVKKHSQNLHPHHFYLMDVKLALCQMIGQSSYGTGSEIFELHEKDLLQKQKLCTEILEVANKISPGVSRLRGVVMYELQATLAAYARKKFSNGEISSDHMKNILQEVKKYLQECIQIFSYEPTCLQEGKLAAIARLDLVELETFMDSVESKKAIQ
uniref:Protein msta n=2 Tax=Lepeophtheirus salmonis TaxID=72036 RepID=A0A0K2TV79_LEPSM